MKTIILIKLLNNYYYIWYSELYIINYEIKNYIGYGLVRNLTPKYIILYAKFSAKITDH